VSEVGQGPAAVSKPDRPRASLGKATSATPITASALECSPVSVDHQLVTWAEPVATWTRASPTATAFSARYTPTSTTAIPIASPNPRRNTAASSTSVTASWGRHLIPATLRTHAEISRFFDGLELMPPGVVQLPRWAPGERRTGAGEDGARLLRARPQALIRPAGMVASRPRLTSAFASSAIRQPACVTELITARSGEGGSSSREPGSRAGKQQG
jgi:S-adenosyl methyltransferase